MFFFHILVSALANSIYKIISLITRPFIANYFGVGDISDIILYIITIPIRLRRLYCDTSIRNILIPTYNKDKTKILFYLVPWIALIINLINIIIYILSYIAQSNFIYFFSNNFSNTQYMIYLFNMILPYICFAILTNILSSYLEFKKYFFLTSIIPSIYNLSIICSIYGYQFSKDSGLNIVIYILLSGIIQLSIVIIYFIYLNISIKLTIQPFYKIKNYLYDIFKINIGEYAIQINVLISTAMMQSIPKATTYLILATGIYYIPITILGKAIKTVILPYFCNNSNPIQRFYSSSIFFFAFSIIITPVFYYYSLDITYLFLIYKSNLSYTDIQYISNNLAIFFLALPPHLLYSIPISLLYYKKVIWPTVYITSGVSLLNIILNICTISYLSFYTYAFNFTVVYWIYTVLLYILTIYHIKNNEHIQLSKLQDNK